MYLFTSSFTDYKFQFTSFPLHQFEIFLTYFNLHQSLVFLFTIYVSKLSSANSAQIAIPIIKMNKNFHFLMDIHPFITNHARLFITDIKKDNI